MNQTILRAAGLLAALVFSASAIAVEAGKPLPACELTALGDTPSVNTSQFKGKVVYVDFWASWCPPCAKSFPYLNVLHRDFQSRGLQIVGVNVDKNTADAKRFLQLHPADFSVGADANGTCPKSFGVPTMPTGYLTDRNGVIRYVHHGFRDSDATELRSQVEQLLN